MRYYNRQEIINRIKSHLDSDFEGVNKLYADHVGCSASMVSYVLKGKKNPTEEMLASIGFERKPLKLYVESGRAA